MRKVEVLARNVQNTNDFVDLLPRLHSVHLAKVGLLESVDSVMHLLQDQEMLVENLGSCLKRGHNNLLV